jgi:hypothetical protein
LIQERVQTMQTPRQPAKASCAKISANGHARPGRLMQSLRGRRFGSTRRLFFLFALAFYRENPWMTAA